MWTSDTSTTSNKLEDDAPEQAVSVPESADTGEGGKLKMIVQLVKKCLGVKDIASMCVFFCWVLGWIVTNGHKRLSLPASLLEPIPPSSRRAPQFLLQGHRFSIPANVTFNQMSTMTLQTLGHLLPTLHLLKYTHAAVMRLQGGPSASSPATSNGSHDEEPASIRPSVSPPPHALATQWWADEAREGRTIRKNKEVLRLLKEEGLTSEEVLNEDEVPKGQLLHSAKMAVKMLKEQGGRPSDHWVHTNSG